MRDDNGGTKFCLSEREAANGLTIDDKLNRICPGYFRLDTLYGSRQNVNPASIFEPSSDGSDSEDGFNLDDEDDEEIDEEEDDEEEFSVREDIAAGRVGDGVALDESPANKAGPQRTPASGSKSVGRSSPVVALDNIAFSRQAMKEVSEVTGRPPSVTGPTTTGPKRSFNEVYAQTKQEELAFKKDEAKAKRSLEEAQAKSTLMVQLLQQGKSKEEIKEYLEMIFRS